MLSIGDNAFLACFNLKKVVFPPNLKEIHDFAFYDCVKLTSLRNTHSLTYVGKQAFNKTSITCGYLLENPKRYLYRDSISCPGFTYLNQKKQRFNQYGGLMFAMYYL